MSWHLSWLQRHQTIFWLSLLLLLIALGVSLLAGTITQRIVTVLFINLILVVALQMFMGNSGVASFAHVGFMGIGAYTSILLPCPRV